MCRFTALVLLCSLLLSNSGCATYTALKMPGPANDEQVKLGMHRRDVDTVLGVLPGGTFPENGSTIARYEYADGPHQASKARALVYVAGDVFLLFLSELIFWPIELYAESQIKRVATATYDTENVLTEFTVARTDGELLVQLPGEPGEAELQVATANGAAAAEIESGSEPIAPAVDETVALD